MGPCGLCPCSSRHYRQVIVGPYQRKWCKRPEIRPGFVFALSSSRLLQPHGSPAVVRALKYVVQLAAVGAAYFFLARSGLKLGAIYPGAAVVSLPAGFALAAVLLGGYRLVPAIFAAAYVANAGSMTGLDYATAAIAAGYAFEAFVGAVLVDWWAGGREAFAAPGGVAKFALAAVIAAAIGAAGSSAVDVGIGASANIGQV